MNSFEVMENECRSFRRLQKRCAVCECGYMGLTEAKCLELISMLCEATTLTKVLKTHAVSSQEFFKVINSVPHLSSEYSRAQYIRAELLADEVIDIADNESDTQKARNQIDVRKWAASKMRPDKYGDRIDVNVTNTVDIRAALSEAHSRIRDVIAIKPVQITASVDDLEDLLK